MNITYECLRSFGFRLHSTNCDNKPHMVKVFNHRMDVALEISSQFDNRWTVWVRSDLAGSRCRFCFLREVETQLQLTELWHGLTGVWLVAEPFDEQQFAAALEAEKEDCERRYLEYCKGNRNSYTPGG